MMENSLGLNAARKSLNQSLSSDSVALTAILDFHVE
jgi:hypothetical protein